MSIADVERILDWAGPRNVNPNLISMMGGEPTLHPDLLAIIDFLQAREQSVRILTNLGCTRSLLRELLARNVAFLVNVDQANDGRTACQEQFLSNLEFMFRDDTAQDVSLAVTCVIDEPDKDFAFLFDILRNDTHKRIRALRPAIASPVYKFVTREWVVPSPYVLDMRREYGAAVLHLVKACRQARPDLKFAGECAINSCWVSDQDYKELAPWLRQIRFECLDPNPDILPDFSMQWCFNCRGIDELRIDNVFDYANHDAAVTELYRLRMAFADKYPPVCRPAECPKSRFCRGLCPALDYYFKDSGPPDWPPAKGESGPGRSVLAGACFCGSDKSFSECHGVQLESTKE